jgi:hypothetical protein
MGYFASEQKTPVGAVILSCGIKECPCVDIILMVTENIVRNQVKQAGMIKSCT